MIRLKNFYEKKSWFLGQAGLGGPIQIAFKQDREEAGPWHMHRQAYEYFIMLEGEMVLETPAEALILQKGEIVVFEPGLEHRLLEQSSECRCLILMDRYVENDKVLTRPGS